MEKAEQWKRLLDELKCVHGNKVSSPPGKELTLDFGGTTSPTGPVKAGEQVALTIDGIFLRISAGTTDTYMGLDQLLSVTISALAP